MSIKKRAAALITALTMAASLAGCADTTYVMTADGDNINAGIYIDYMFEAMQSQLYMWQYSGITENFFDQKVDDKDFETYLLDTAMEKTKHYAAIEKLFKESGLKISSEDMKEINNSINDSWENIQKLYESEGISKDSLKKIEVNKKKEEMLFEYYYGTEGKEAVSKDDLVKYMNDNYLRFKGITIYKSTAEDDTTKEAENKANQEMFEKYKEKAEGTSYTDFDALIDEYTAETSATDEEDTGDEEVVDDGTSDDTSSTDDASSDDGSSTSDDASSEEDSSSKDDASSDESVIDESLESHEAGEEDSAAADVDASSADDSSKDDASSADDTSGKDDASSADDASSEDDTTGDADTAEADAEEEVDPYANDRLINYGKLDEETLDSEYGKRLKVVADANIGDVVTYEDDTGYYIFIKGDVTERSSEYLDDEANFDTVLHENKDKDFEAKITKALESISFSENKDALDRYTPKVVYDKYNDYMEKNSKKTTTV